MSRLRPHLLRSFFLAAAMSFATNVLEGESFVLVHLGPGETRVLRVPPR